MVLWYLRLSAQVEDKLTVHPSRDTKNVAEIFCCDSIYLSQNNT